ncbi:unnamed protein product, partial [Polarella glacialis]
MTFQVSYGGCSASLGMHHAAYVACATYVKGSPRTTSTNNNSNNKIIMPGLDQLVNSLFMLGKQLAATFRASIITRNPSCNQSLQASLLSQVASVTASLQAFVPCIIEALAFVPCIVEAYVNASSCQPGSGCFSSAILTASALPPAGQQLDLMAVSLRIPRGGRALRSPLRNLGHQCMFQTSSLPTVRGPNVFTPRCGKLAATGPQDSSLQQQAHKFKGCSSSFEQLASVAQAASFHQVVFAVMAGRKALSSKVSSRHGCQVLLRASPGLRT